MLVLIVGSGWRGLERLGSSESKCGDRCGERGSTLRDESELEGCTSTVDPYGTGLVERLEVAEEDDG